MDFFLLLFKFISLINYMDPKYCSKTQREVSTVLKSLFEWKNLFSIKVKYFYEGWAVYLREKSMYPRCIVIFKPYSKESFSIKSFEINFDKTKNDSYKELYVSESIYSISNLLSEIKQIIYGKDILGSIKKLL